MRLAIVFVFFGILIFSCQTEKKNVPVVAFADAFEDNTLSKARNGFFAALSENGFDESKGTLEVIYRNAQGNIPTLTQIINYFISKKPDLIATCPTLPTITAVQNTKDIPVFMMVSGTPELMNLMDKNGKAPSNLLGVGEDLGYIDTSFLLISKIVRPKGAVPVVGMIYNQSEPQSVEAMERIRKLAFENNMQLIALPVNASAEVQLVTASLLTKNPDVFFANPDNTVFASFETIVKSCDEAGIPVITSESGLVERGALAAYGADIYQWGYQSGLQAARFLQSRKMDELSWEMVKIRKRVYNKKAAEKYGIQLPPDFEPLP